MKINSNTKLLSDRVVLVPYEEDHVPKYHLWMQSEELQLLTASEPLTLEKEYEMQKSWRIDEDKCTFIILDKSIYDNKNDEVEAMIGDTNLFIDCEDCHKAEIEIMIACEQARGKGYGWESTILMLMYGITFLNIKTYLAKISFTNKISISMFLKLGFIETHRSEVFQEITLEKTVEKDWVYSLKEKCPFKSVTY